MRAFAIVQSLVFIDFHDFIVFVCFFSCKGLAAKLSPSLAQGVHVCGCLRSGWMFLMPFCQVQKKRVRKE